MAPNRRILALAPMEELLKAAGCERVGEDAKAALREHLEEEAEAFWKDGR